MSDQNRSAGESGKADKVKAKAAEAKEQVQEKVSHAAEEVREQGEHLVDEGKDKARELAHEAGERARTRADREKERVTVGIRSMAEALRNGGQQLPEDRREYQPLLNSVAERVENVSGYLDSHSVDDLTRDVRRFAREHAPLFLTGAFALGMLGARFMKSSGEQARNGRYGEFDRFSGYDRTTAYGAQTGYGTQTGYDTRAGYERQRSDRLLPEPDHTAARPGTSGRTPERGGGGGYA